MKEREIFKAAIILLIAVFFVNSLIPFFTGSAQALIVLSGSMTPLMLPGDMIVAKSVNSDELTVGDVVVFRGVGEKADSLVTHRIISIQEGKERVFQTKGDANEEKDDFTVPASKVVGKLTFVIPFAGYLPEASKNKNLFFLTVILPAGLIVLDEMKNIIKYSNPARARKIEREQKKVARRTSYIIHGKRLVTLVFITGFIFTGVFLQNMGENGSVVLGEENTVENSGVLSTVYVFTPADSEQKFAIEPWYGVIPSANATQVIAPENTPAKLSTVPYILPVFWITELAEINPYFPVAAGILLYVSVFTLLLFPFWYQKSGTGARRQKIRAQRLLVRCKRALNLG
ncbi:MAG: signal peptidase I [Methanosarcina vacuolata]|jgi:signal peptidase|nr:signal peptidase I [Methanosarcina vacuolata]